MHLTHILHTPLTHGHTITAAAHACMSHEPCAHRCLMITWLPTCTTLAWPPYLGFALFCGELSRDSQVPFSCPSFWQGLRFTVHKARIWTRSTLVRLELSLMLQQFLMALGRAMCFAVAIKELATTAMSSRASGDAWICRRLHHGLLCRAQCHNHRHRHRHRSHHHHQYHNRVCRRLPPRNLPLSRQLHTCSGTNWMLLGGSWMQARLRLLGCSGHRHPQLIYHYLGQWRSSSGGHAVAASISSAQRHTSGQQHLARIWWRSRHRHSHRSGDSRRHRVRYRCHCQMSTRCSWNGQRGLGLARQNGYKRSETVVRHSHNGGPLVYILIILDDGSAMYRVHAKYTQFSRSYSRPRNGSTDL